MPDLQKIYEWREANQWARGKYEKKYLSIKFGKHELYDWQFVLNLIDKIGEPKLNKGWRQQYGNS